MISGKKVAAATLLGALLLAGCSDDNNSVYTPPINNGNTTVVAPVAVADAFSGRGNAQITGNVLSNDTVNSATITNSTTPAHGAVVLNTDGTFTYTPTTGYLGSDSFTYTLGNSAGTSTATVSLSLAGTAIFVNNQSAAGGDGSQAHPFSTLAAAVTAATGVDGAQIVVAQGDGTSTGLNTAVTLSSNQSIVALSASAQPTLTGPINFTQGNSLSNLRIIGTTGTAVNATGAINGTLTGVTIANTTGRALDLTNSTGTFVFTGGAVSNVPARGAIGSDSDSGIIAWSVTNSTFANNTLVSSGANVTGTANQTITLSGNTYAGDRNDATAFVADGNSTLAANVTNNTVSGAGTALRGVDISTAGNAVLLARILSNHITGCTDAGIKAIVGVNSTGKIRFESNSTTGNIPNGGFQMANGDTAALYTTLTNNTSDSYNIVQGGTLNLVVENLQAFTTNNTGSLFTNGNVVTAAAGTSGIP